MTDVNTFLREFFGGVMLRLTDPAEYYAEKTRKEFRELYEEGRVDCVPEITGHIDEETGEVVIHINWLPPQIRDICATFRHSPPKGD